MTIVEEHIRLHVGFSLSLILGCEQCGTGVQLWLLGAWGILGAVLWGGSGLPGEEEAADGGLTGCPRALPSC